MNLAAIILQLSILCNEIAGNSVAVCKYEMRECAKKHYNTQQVESTVDYCVKKFLNK